MLCKIIRNPRTIMNDYVDAVNDGDQIDDFDDSYKAHNCLL
jgi:hypothetical protein